MDPRAINPTSFRFRCWSWSIFPSICRRSSVEILHAGCLSEYEVLWSVTFEADSRLSRIEDCAFSSCSALSLIVILSSVEVLCEESFYQCAALSMVAFEAGSNLSRIESGAFRGCSSLSSICLPSPVTTFWEGCFDGCEIRAGLGSLLSPDDLRRAARAREREEDVDEFAWE
jgi:hypothetical protein